MRTQTHGQGTTEVIIGKHHSPLPIHRLSLHGKEAFEAYKRNNSTIDDAPPFAPPGDGAYNWGRGGKWGIVTRRGKKHKYYVGHYYEGPRDRSVHVKTLHC